MNRIKQIEDKFNEVIKDANSKLNIILPHIHLDFDLEGKTIGRAICALIDDNIHYIVKLNSYVIHNDGFEYILNNTIPHEIAHIVTHYCGYGMKHDKIWKQICILLGGNGHVYCRANITLKKTRNVKEYLYMTTCGNKVKVSSIRHKRIQEGKTYYLKSTKGKVIKEQFVEL